MGAKTEEQTARAVELWAFLTEHPDSHDQAWWILRFGVRDSQLDADEPLTAARALAECGTTACAAGWTALLAGGTFYGKFGYMPDGSEGSAYELGKNLLGLDTLEADQLFYKSLTLDDVGKAIENIFGVTLER
jgi:hypothetical protein